MMDIFGFMDERGYKVSDTDEAVWWAEWWDAYSSGTLFGGWCLLEVKEYIRRNDFVMEYYRYRSSFCDAHWDSDDWGEVYGMRSMV